MHLHTPRRGIRPIEEGPRERSGRMDEIFSSPNGQNRENQWQVLRGIFLVYHVVVVVVAVVPYLYVCEFDNLTTTACVYCLYKMTG